MRSVVPGAIAAALALAAMAAAVVGSAGVPRVAATLAVGSPPPGAGESSAVSRAELPPESRTVLAGDVAVVLPDTGALPPAQTDVEPGSEGEVTVDADPRATLPAGLIAYTLDTGTGTDVFVRRLDGPDERRLSRSPFADVDPDLSPDGRLVVYQSYVEPQGDNADIVVVAADGNGRRNLTRAADLDNHTPAFSPDGRRIAFTSRRGGGLPVLWTMAVDGSDVRILTRQRCADADWSPDGTQLVCVGDPVGFGGKDLWLVSAESGEMRPLTTTAEPEIRPTWSPDGQRIAYQKHVHGQWMVTVEAPDGTGRREIGPGTNPVWAPDGTLAWAGPFGLSLLSPPFRGPPLVPGDLVGRLGSWVG